MDWFVYSYLSRHDKRTSAASGWEKEIGKKGEKLEGGGREIRTGKSTAELERQQYTTRTTERTKKLIWQV